MKKIFFFLLAVCTTFSMAAQTCGGTTGGGSSSSNTGSFASGASSSSSLQGSQQGFQTLAGTTNASSMRLFNAVTSGQYSAVKLSYKDIEGSPYMTEEAVNGHIVMNNGDVIRDVPVQYDLYANEVIATNDDGEEIVLDARFYKEVVMEVDGEEVIFAKMNEKNPDKFYEVLYYDRGFSFFKASYAKLREGRNLGMVEMPSRFKHSTEYFVKQSDGEISKVNLKKKEIFDLFPQIEVVAMEEYLKKNKMKLKKEGDYIALFSSVTK